MEGRRWGPWSTEYKERTVREFVKKLCLEDHDDAWIIIVAQHTRWHKNMQEVKDWLQRRGDRWRKLGNDDPLKASQVKRFMNYGKTSAQVEQMQRQ